MSDNQEKFNALSFIRDGDVDYEDPQIMEKLENITPSQFEILNNEAEHKIPVPNDADDWFYYSGLGRMKKGRYDRIYIPGYRETKNQVQLLQEARANFVKELNKYNVILPGSVVNTRDIDLKTAEEAFMETTGRTIQDISVQIDNIRQQQQKAP